MQILTDGQGAALQFPYSYDQLRADLRARFPAMMLPRVFDPAFAAEHGVFDVAMPEAPTPAAGNVVEPGTPIHAPGTWVQPTEPVLDEDGNDTGETQPVYGSMQNVDTGEVDEDGAPILRRQFVPFDPPTVAERYGTWAAEWVERAKTAEELAAERAEAQDVMLRWIGEFLSPILSKYPEAERLSWGPKASAADAYLASTASARQTAMIETEATAKGVTGTEVATKIAAMAAKFEGAATYTAGLRQRAAAAIDASTEPMADLATFRAEAEATAASIGLFD